VCSPSEQELGSILEILPHQSSLVTDSVRLFS
jgi:hypothetical protein